MSSSPSPQLEAGSGSVPGVRLPVGALPEAGTIAPFVLAKFFPRRYASLPGSIPVLLDRVVDDATAEKWVRIMAQIRTLWDCELTEGATSPGT